MKRFYCLSVVVIQFLLIPFLINGQGVIVPSGIYFSAGNGTMMVQGNFVNNGSFTASNSAQSLTGNFTNNGAIAITGGTITFSGITQAIAGSAATNFNNITIGQGSTTTISTAGQTLKGVLLCNGTLIANGKITLLSTAAQTALIDGAGTGQVTGTVTLQRYLPSAFGYKYVSSPFQSATVSGFAPYVDLAAAFPSFYNFDENQPSDGWATYTNPSSILTPTKGYAANFGTSKSSVTLSLSGSVNNNAINSSSLYNHHYPYTLGFNLVGNPYPSPIDWNASTGWTRTNIDNAVYFFDAGDTSQYYGKYSSYVNGVSSNGIASNIISAMQGFFIHVTDGSYPVTASLGFSNGVRINNLTPVFHKSADADTRPLLRISAGFSGQLSAADPLVIYFDDAATLRFDPEWDALKILNTDVLTPSLYANSQDAARLSICAMPRPSDTLVTVPLGIRILSDGLITFNVLAVDNMPVGTNIYLADSQSGKYYDLATSMPIEVFLPAGTTEGRFSLKFSSKALIDTEPAGDQFLVFQKNGNLFVRMNPAAGTEGEVMIHDMTGKMVATKHLAGNGVHAVDVSLSDGIYVISLLTQSGRQSKKIFISNL